MMRNRIVQLPLHQRGDLLFLKERVAVFFALGEFIRYLIVAQSVEFTQTR